MIIFFTDLDNTMIYSYKHDIGTDKKMVELYQGREISFVTDKTWVLLKDVKEKCMVIPTTTRTIEQYERIDLGVGEFTYALACNGGILLEKGVENAKWYEESIRRVEASVPEMKKAMDLLEQDQRRTFEIRFIRDLFVFTKCQEPESVVNELRTMLDEKKVDVFNNGIKVYVVPKALSKGVALVRMREKLLQNADTVKTIAAGDSEFDVSILNEADLGVAPQTLKERYELKDTVSVVPGHRLFSEGVLEFVKQQIEE